MKKLIFLFIMLPVLTNAQKNNFSLGMLVTNKMKNNALAFQASFTYENVYISIASNGVTGDGDQLKRKLIPKKAERLDKKVFYVCYLGYDYKVNDLAYLRPKVGFYLDQNIYQVEQTYLKKTGICMATIGLDFVIKTEKVSFSIGTGTAENVSFGIGINF